MISKKDLSEQDIPTKYITPAIEKSHGIMNEERNIIIYNTADGKASVSFYAKDGSVWMNQNQLAELFDTSKQNIGQHTSNILKECE